MENAASYLIDGSAGVEARDGTYSEVGLAGTSPNPFGRRTEIAYFIPAKQPVHLAIYDVQGRLVKTLVSDVKEPGFHRTTWYGKDRRARELSPGVYFSRFVTPTLTQTRKIVKIR